MEFKELIKKRQSDRKYLSTQVEEEKIMQCIESARLAPSACNAQPWKFIVVDEPELKNRIADCAESMGMNKFSHEAPVIIAIVLEKPNLTSKIGSVLKDKEYTLMDIGIASLQFCLQATAEGLGTCILGWFNEKKVKKLLNIPKSKRAELIITLGYPSSQTIRPKVRKKIEEISCYNSYQ